MLADAVVFLAMFTACMFLLTPPIKKWRRSNEPSKVSEGIWTALVVLIMSLLELVVFLMLMWINIEPPIQYLPLAFAATATAGIYLQVSAWREGVRNGA